MRLKRVALASPSHISCPASSAKHVGNLERFGLRVENMDSRCNPLFSYDHSGRCRKGLMSSSQVKFMATAKIEKAGVGFGIGRQGGSIVIEVRPHHDTISALRGVQFGFELLNGITPDRAKKILDVLNENVIGAVVTTAADDKTEAASG